MTKRIILFNGPPGSGKDTAGLAINGQYPSTTRIKFSDPVKNGTHGAYGLRGIDVDFFEDRKDVPCEEFYGITPRQAYIAYSEKLMKPLHGDDIFGRIAAKAMEESYSQIICVPDSGFLSEAKPVVDLFSARSVLLFRIEREGHDYSNDSRSKIDLGPDVETYDVINKEGEMLAFQNSIRNIFERWVRT